MADSGQRVTLEAIFKSSGLDRLGRQFDGVSQRMRRMGEAMKNWGAGPGGGQDFAKQFQAGMEIEKSQQRLNKAKDAYRRIQSEIDRAQSPEKRARLEQHLQSVVRIGERELSLQDRLGRKEVERQTKMMSAMTLRRGLRLGLGVLGLPMSIGAAGRAISEATGQERETLGMAARLRETNAPIQDFTKYTMDLRKSIVDAGAEFAYSGREAIQLADNLSQLAGGMVDLRQVYSMARGFGMAPQAVGQYLATARRFGGREAPPDEKLMNIVARGISQSGMSPRSSEFVQAVVSAMQTYSSRLPAVMPGTLTTLLAALSSEQGMGGGPGVGRLAPTLRGQGGMQVISGLTSMMDDASEAMIAIQTELVARDPRAFSKTAGSLGIDVSKGTLGGSERYLLTMALKQAGVADPDGLKLAGRSIKEMTRGMDNATRVSIESLLLRMSPQLVNALEKAGFMDALREGRLSESQFAKAVQDARGREEEVMGTPAMGWGVLKNTIQAELATQFEKRAVSPTGRWARAWSEQLKEDPYGAMASALPLLGMGAANMIESARQAPMAVTKGLAKSSISSFDRVSQALGAPTIGQAIEGLGLGGKGFLSEGAGRKSLDITVRVSGDIRSNIATISGGITEAVMTLMGENLKATGSNSIYVTGMTHPLSDKMGS